ncbi:V-type proton ATPase catalytic subunit A [Hibiscus syriacus]|uniref:V-type proton ATPase catalytic subunit A n=1 Tax=Hibiscus syriacus TaxID=106335 RepID=A0A6A2YN94_HIBSY|nr:V-type proton ATPase catalytic subunit A [Hibiscus syriacus]
MGCGRDQTQTPNDIQHTCYGFRAQKGCNGGSSTLYEWGRILQKRTGKSSLIAAMANYLKYDIYDLDLTDVHTNSDLRFLLLTMPNRSILVIEDIDCSIKLQNRESETESDENQGDNQVTLSGLLNFIDGLWSCCGEERIIIFTTNHKEWLDPSLVRPVGWTCIFRCRTAMHPYSNNLPSTISVSATMVFLSRLRGC